MRKNMAVVAYRLMTRVAALNAVLLRAEVAVTAMVCDAPVRGRKAEMGKLLASVGSRVMAFILFGLDEKREKTAVLQRFCADTRIGKLSYSLMECDSCQACQNTRFIAAWKPWLNRASVAWGGVRFATSRYTRHVH